MSDKQKILSLYKAGKIEDSTLIKAAAFKQELEQFLIEKSSQEKTASFKSDAGRIALLSALAAPVFAASTYATGKAIHETEEMWGRKSRADDFDKMLEFRPELKQEDPLLIKKYYDSLVHFSPAIANDPLAAGAYIKQAIQYEEVGGPPYSTIQSLVNTQASYRQSQPFKAIGLGETIAEKAGKVVT